MRFPWINTFYHLDREKSISILPCVRREISKILKYINVTIVWWFESLPFCHNGLNSSLGVSFWNVCIIRIIGRIKPDDILESSWQSECTQRKLISHRILTRTAANCFHCCFQIYYGVARRIKTVCSWIYGDFNWIFTDVNNFHHESLPIYWIGQNDPTIGVYIGSIRSLDRVRSWSVYRWFFAADQDKKGPKHV